MFKDVGRFSLASLHNKEGRTVTSTDDGWIFLYFIEKETGKVYLLSEEKIKVSDKKS